MITLLLYGALALVLLFVVLLFIGLPLMLLCSLAPLVLGVVGVVLLVRAVLQKPMALENFTPAILVILLAGVLRWIF